ncbi:SCAN domain-containing protein 3 [Channa argus]|uniref:SCAN domain-containing protein 3 n=1 Tax=Channa argus TaxID=215402 RepID=A0A6G1Q8H8_CHAAH|nr:SCAN domain-containing protein 3 [Channa argus]
MFQTLAGILGDTEPEPSFSQLVHDHLSLLFKDFERYFPTTQDPRTGKDWIRDPFVNKPGESSKSVKKKISCWTSQMTAALRQQLCRCSGLKSWQKTPRSAPQH